MSGLFDLAGKSAIVTGATRGIGRAIAEVLIAQGARVVISDLLPATGEGSLREYTSYLLGASSLWLAVQQGVREFRTVRADLPAVDLTTSWHFAPGLSGITAASTAINPTNETLSAAATWSLSVSPMTEASRKSIAAVKIVSNAV